MFRIGEFSQIARVSGRLLRYYDSIGLLRPQRIDPETGYRYYSAGQLQQLNRILALKELGLSLDQVARMLDERISVAEIRGMLALKKAELEQSMAAEAARLRHIESRLLQIEQQGSLGDYDVVLKSAPALPFLALRGTYPTFDDVVAAIGEVFRAARAQLASQALAQLVVVAHSDFEDQDLDLEIGVTLTRNVNKPVRLPTRGASGRRKSCATRTRTWCSTVPGSRPSASASCLLLSASSTQSRRIRTRSGGGGSALTRPRSLAGRAGW